MTLNEHFIWASFFWGSVATGYLMFGWRQRTMPPFITGILMIAASYFIGSAALMSLACIVLVVGIWWLARRGH